MAFDRENLAPITTDGANSFYVYTTTDDELTVLAPGYFQEVSIIFDVDTVLLIHTADGTDFASVISTDPMTMTTSSRLVIDTLIVANNSITRVEIETGLASVGIELPLKNSMTIYFYDSTSTTREKTYLCRYALSIDQWFFEKMNAVPATGAEVSVDPEFSFEVAVSNGNKITSSEIELAITDAGFNSPPTISIAIYVRDSSRADRMYLCRYDVGATEWFYERLTLST